MYENLKKEVELVWEDHDHIRDDQAQNRNPRNGAPAR